MIFFSPIFLPFEQTPFLKPSFSWSFLNSSSFSWFSSSLSGRSLSG